MIMPAVVSLAACAPLLLGQRRAFTAKTWLPPAKLNDIDVFIEAIFPALTLTVILVGWCISRLKSDTEPDCSPSMSPNPITELAGLFGLSFVFVPVVILSFLVQSFMVNRYGITTMAGMSVPIALLATQMSRRIQWLVSVALIVISAAGLHAIASADAKFAQHVYSRLDLIRSLPSDSIAVFVEQNEPFQVDGAAPDLKDRVWLLGFDMDPATHFAENASFGTQAATNFGRYFGYPAIATRSMLLGRSHFHLIGPNLNAGQLTQAFPGFSVARQEDELVELRRP